MNNYSKEEILLLSRSYLDKPIETLSIEELNILKHIVAYHNGLYYKESTPIISDYDYDRLYHLLKQIESTQNLSSEDLLSQQIGDSILENSQVQAHFTPMLSLENSYNETDLMNFNERMSAFFSTTSIAYNVEPKLDGAGVSLYYKNNILQRALTRGDGQKGEDITPHVRTIKSLPTEVDFSKYGLEEVEIRGEIVLEKEHFKSFNKEILLQGGIPLANPRNAVSGTLRLKNMEDVKKRTLSLFLYHISYYKSSLKTLVSQYDSVQMLTNLGFPTMMDRGLVKRLNGMQEVIDYCKQIEKERESLSYEIDGMVIKIDDIHIQDKIGSTSHHPRWAMALKFKPQQVVSTLKEVEFQVGRTGIITPVAKINPVALGGVTIKSISLFNEENIREKDLRIGDEVLVERAGDVIPYIAKNLPQKRSGVEKVILFPKICPSCEGDLAKIEASDAAWRCINYHCPAQNIQRIIHFASKDAMDIQGLGEKWINHFVNKGYLKEISDIYTLPWDELKTLEGLGEKSIEKLKKEIEKSKKQPIYRLIFGLGIRFVGEGTAKTLAKHINHLMDLKQMTEEELQNLEDVGKKVSLSILGYFNDESNILLLNTLENQGLNFKSTVTINTGILSGKTFLFTGSLLQLDRKEAQNKVEEKGGKILSSVSNQLNYLVVGEKPGSKLKKAQKIDSIQILNEQQFIQMIENL